MENDKKISFTDDDTDKHAPGGNAENPNMPYLPPSPKGRWSLMSDNYDQVKSTGDTPEKANIIPSADKASKLFTKPGILKYRSEQLTITKINGVIENHAETKSEYHIQQYINNSNYFTDVYLADRVVTIYPDSLQEALNLVGEVDVLKNNVAVVINKDTGKIEKINNIADIQKDWAELKKQIKSRYAFIHSEETQKNLETFLSQSEMQLTEAGIQLYFTAQPFFDIYFDKYLVAQNFVPSASDTKTYYSQLFDQLPVIMNVKPEIIHETPESVTYVRSADRLTNGYNTAQIEEIYNRRYKPQIGYKFSEYEYSHRTEYTVNHTENILEQATMNITEGVKNNVEIIIDYKLRRISS